MRVLSLFSGICAHDLGLQMAGLTIAGQVEIDPYCYAVLEKHWPNVPRWTDVRTVTGADVSRRCGRIDVITGGFPCQNISTAGRGGGLHGDRSSLFFELARVIDEVRPTWFLLENVPALRSRGGDRVLAELDGLGYARWPCVVGAWACGAPHKRDRVWIVGHRMADASGEVAVRHTRRTTTAHAMSGNGSRAGELAIASGAGLEGRRGGSCGSSTAQSVFTGVGVPRWPARPGEAQHEWEASRLIVDYSPRRNGHDVRRISPQGDAEGHRTGEEPGPTEPGLGDATARATRRLAGFARRNALKALGNANPPHVPYLIGRWMMEQDRG